MSNPSQNSQPETELEGEGQEDQVNTENTNDSVEATGKVETPPETSQIPKCVSKSELNGMFQNITIGLNSFLQSQEQFEQTLHPYMLQCLAYAKPQKEGGYGDAVPADKLVKLLYQNRRTHELALECVAWFRRMSPIRWGSSKDPLQAPVRIAKEGEADYRAFDDNAPQVPFSQLAEVQANRAARRKVAERMVKPFGLENIYGWINTLEEKFKNAGKSIDGKQPRGYVKGEKKKAADCIHDLKKVVSEYYGGDSEETEEHEKQKEAA